MATTTPPRLPIIQPRVHATPTPPDTPIITSPTRPPLPEHAPAPTRVVGGPVLLRVTGAPTPRQRYPVSSDPQLRYAFIFRLDHPHLGDNASGLYRVIVPGH